MNKLTYKFTNSSTDFYLAHGISHLKKITDPKATVIITDENVFNAHTKRFKGWNTIVLKPGEEFKVQATVDAVIEKLIEMEADRKTTLVGVGGGVITDITGYVASVYMRGLRFGFVPTSIFHGIFVANLFCSSFLLGKGKKNHSCTLVILFSN